LRDLLLDVIFNEIDKVDFLSVFIEGNWLEEDVIPVLEAIRERAKDLQYYKVFIDALKLNPPLSEMIRFYTGEKIASIWGASLKVAVHGPAEHINRFTETVAINRGAFSFRVFDNLEEAMQWLA
jgi:hypothetical protein